MLHLAIPQISLSNLNYSSEKSAVRQEEKGYYERSVDCIVKCERGRKASDALHFFILHERRPEKWVKTRYLGRKIGRLLSGSMTGPLVALIAEKIGVHPATIYRELRNGYTGAVDKYGFRVYSAKVAQITAERNFQKSAAKRQAAL